MSQHPSVRPSLPRRTAFAAHLLCMSLAACAATALPHAAMAQPASAAASGAAARNYSIPAGPLGQALNWLGRESGTLITFAPELVAGVQSPGARGSLTLEQALNALLTGTGLEPVSSVAGEYTLQRTPAAANRPVSKDAIALGEVQVVASAERDATTEGTGSYTTRSTAAATGLALSLRETPQSVSVLTRQQMDDHNVETIEDALKSVTGISSTGAPGDNRTYFYSRGFQITRMQYDGVSTSANSITGEQGDNMATDMVFYDRVEVVRGSTGLLTGSGEPSASINMVRKRANSHTFTGSAALGLGSWNNARGMVDLSTPLVEDGRIRGRVVAMAQDRDSFIDLAGGKAKAFMAVVDADLAPGTTLSLGADYQQSRQRAPAWGGLPLYFSDGSPTDWDRSKTNSADWSFRDSTNRSVFINLDHRFDNDWKIKANVAQRRSKSEAQLVNLSGDVDRATGSGLIANYPYHSLGDTQQTSTSIQATGPFDLLGRKHEAVIGWTESRYKTHLVSDVKGGVPIANFYNYDGHISAPNWTMQDLGTGAIRENGFYGALRLTLRDDLKLILGGRQSHWETTPAEGNSRSFNQFTPYAGLVYDLDARHSLYASQTDVFQPQSYRDVNGAYLDPETGYTREVGIKGEYFDGRLNASLAAFSSQKDNVATRDGMNVAAGTSDWAYVGEKGVKSRGFEVQFSGELQPGWNVSAGFAKTLARKLDGSRLNSLIVPTNQLRLRTSYRLRGEWSRWTAGAGLNWQSDISTDANTRVGVLPIGQRAYALADLMLRYAVNSKLSVQLNINNLFDKKYWAAIDGTGYFGTPRSAMLNATYKF